MTQNETLIFDSLFLHDTQMAGLEREQTALRRQYLAMTAAQPRENPTFNFALPFCPLAGTAPLAGKLTIGPAIVRGGWIVRPVSGQAAGGAALDRGISVPNTGRQAIPGFPQLPDAVGFILGYAGDFAEPLLEQASRSADAAESGVARGFSVSARYRAALTLEIGNAKRGAFSCAWTVGPARWEKA